MTRTLGGGGLAGEISPGQSDDSQSQFGWIWVIS